MEFKKKLQGMGLRYLWQRRFWEHTVRDDADYERCCDYLHYNPVKHGLTSSPNKWKYSTFRQYVKAGLYPEDWGGDAAVSVSGAEYDQ